MLSNHGLPRGSHEHCMDTPKDSWWPSLTFCPGHLSRTPANVLDRPHLRDPESRGFRIEHAYVSDGDSSVSEMVVFTPFLARPGTRSSCFSTCAFFWGILLFSRQFGTGKSWRVCSSDGELLDREHWGCILCMDIISDNLTPPIDV